MTIPNKVYTYEMNHGTLFIYEWVFKDFLLENELLYHNYSLGLDTIINGGYEDQETFAVANDVFLERLDVLQAIGDIEIQFKLGELDE